MKLFDQYRVNPPPSDITFQLVRNSDDGDVALFEIANRHGRNLITANRFTFEIMSLNTFEEFIAAIDREIGKEVAS